MPGAAPPTRRRFRITRPSADQCVRPYSASVFNVSAMSFGFAISANAIRALNAGAKRGGF